MKVKVDSLSNIKKKLSVTVPEGDVIEGLDEAYRKVGQQAQIPGFRPGKIPRSLLEKRFGSAVEAEVYQDLVKKTVAQALDENKLNAIHVSEITDPQRKEGEGFSYVASIEVKPEIDPQDYHGVKIKGTQTEVTEEQVEAVYKQLGDAHAVLKHREGIKKPKSGDFVSVLLEETDEEGNLKTNKDTPEPKEQTFELGAQVLQPELEKHILSLKLEETKPITLKSKEEKEIHLRTTLKAIKEKILPERNDEFAKSVGPFENLAALHAKIEEDLKQEMETKSKTDNSRALLDAILKKNPVELPDSLVDSELHDLMHGVWDRLRQAGIKDVPAEYSEDKLRKEMRPDAVRRVHEQLLLEGIANKEKIEVASSQVDERIGQMAASTKVPAAELRSYYEKSGRLSLLHFQLLAQKTLDFLLAKAIIK